MDPRKRQECYHASKLAEARVYLTDLTEATEGLPPTENKDVLLKKLKEISDTIEHKSTEDVQKILVFLRKMAIAIS